jgi:hypothetical protein
MLSLEIYHGEAHDSAKFENCSFSKWRNLALSTYILATMITSPDCFSSLLRGCIQDRISVDKLRYGDRLNTILKTE